MANEQHDARTPESLVGYIASDTSMGTDRNGQPEFKARYKRPTSIRTENGWEKGPSEYGNLRISGPKAEAALEKFRDMDAFIAVGNAEAYPRDDGRTDLFFFATDIGHNSALMDYTVDRTRQIALKQGWDQQREARRSQETAQQAEQPEPTIEAPAPPAATPAAPSGAAGFAASDSAPAPPPPGGDTAIAAREAMIASEQAQTVSGYGSHDSIAR